MKYLHLNSIDFKRKRTQHSPAHREKPVVVQVIESTPEKLPFVAGKWPKGRDIVQVQVANYKGKPVVDIRVWYLAGDMLKPSPKGITLPISQLHEVVSALDDALWFAYETRMLPIEGVI